MQKTRVEWRRGMPAQAPVGGHATTVGKKLMLQRTMLDLQYQYLPTTDGT